MKSTEETQKVVWIADQHMEYYNLPQYMVQHWTCVYELNGTLTDLVKFLAISYKVAIRLLNLLAKLAVYKANIMEEVDQYKLRISVSYGNQYKSQNSKDIKDIIKNSSEK